VTWELQLARMAHAVRYEDLPPELVEHTKTLLLDTLGCALGAVGCPPAKALTRAASSAWPGGGPATLLGSSERASAEVATLLNGTLIRYLDFNDIYEGLEPIHPSENIAAAIACCEEAGAGGKRLVEAIVAGYEAHIRFSRAYAFIKRGLHPVSAAGWVAPLIAGKAWGMDPESIAHGIALSGARTQTLTVISRGDIGMAKATGYAFPSMDGVFAARVAREGFTGPVAAMQWLFDKVQPPQADPSFEVDLDSYRMLGVSLKRFPVQFELQSVVEACVQLAGPLRGRHEQIARIEVGTYRKVIDRAADRSKYEPTTRETADHSLPVCAALALADGRLDAGQFDRDRWKDADIRRLMACTEAHIDDELLQRFPKGRGARVTVTLRDGSTHSRLVEIPEGDHARPLAAAQVQAKFMEQAVCAIGTSRAERVIHEVAALERASSLQPLLSQMGATLH